MEAVSNAWHSLAIKPEKMRERGGEKTEEKTGETERKGDPGQEKKTRRQTKRENRELNPALVYSQNSSIIYK